MTDIPSRDALIEAGARALCAARELEWENQTSALTSAGGDDDEQTAFRYEAAAILDAILPLVLAGAGEALGPFRRELDAYEAAAPDYIDAVRDGLEIENATNEPGRITIGDLRRARAAVAQINTLIGESKGTDTDTKGAADV